MGDEASSRTATPDEVEQMAALVREAMDAGAAGFATSFAITHLGADGKPIPSRWSDRAELEALFRAQADSGRGALGINGVNEELHFDEIYDLQRELGIPVTWTALLTQLDRQPPQGARPCTARAWRRARRCSRRCRRAR